MGGTIGIIVREEDGKVHKMARWTNSLPYFTRNLKFINKDKKHLEDYLQVFYDMVDEYDELQKSKENGTFKEGTFVGMCDVYVPDSGHIAPIEYGIVVIDYQTNQIHHAQGYCSLDNVFEHDVEKMYRLRKEDKEDIQALIDAKKIIYQEIAPQDKDELIKAELKYEEIDGKLTVSTVEEYSEDEYWKGSFILDMSPWKITEYEENLEGYTQIKAKILELGFEISEEDDKLWEQYIQRYKEEEEC